MATIIKRKKKDGAASWLAQISITRHGKRVWRENKTFETLSFAPAAKEWRDAHGPCATCTPQNGFDPAGQIAGAPPVVWQDVRLRLFNDSGEEPPVSEVHWPKTALYALGMKSRIKRASTIR